VRGQEEHPKTLSQAQILELLSGGEIQVEGLIPWSSNATLLVTVSQDGLSTLAVYKPQRGERPLWDFGHGTLGKREVATYLVSEALSWGLVPPTVLRDGPYGLGSVQFCIDAREDVHFFSIQDDPDYRQELERLTALDVIANNADRKAGHCLLDGEGRLWAIDNALCFHAEPKLRTVIWDFAGLPLPETVLPGLGLLADALEAGSPLSQALDTLLTDREVSALRSRLDRLMEQGRFPVPGGERAVPWPLI
jgi:uncharacterized repeat protein (TIGR03843 family)